MSDLESMSDDTWPTLLQHVLEYVTLLTNGRRRLEGQGAAGGEKEEVSLLWAALSPGTIAMVARGIKHS